MSARTSTDLEGVLSERGKRVAPAAIIDPQESSRYISFIYGFPDAASLPNATVLEATERALEQHAAWALQYGRATGAPALAEVLLQKLARDQGIQARDENLIITVGSSQGIELLLQLFVDPGDLVIAESPTFLGFIDSLSQAGGRLATVPVDDEGTDVDALEQLLEALHAAGTPPKFIYLISNFQNPTGISTGLQRRQRIVELAERHGVFLVEDDAYFDLRYGGESIPTLYSLDRCGRTVYLGTLSKIMGAGLRIGWLVAPPEIIQRLAQLKADGGTNIFGSHIAADWIPRHLATHVDELRTIYRGRRDRMLDALERHMPPGVHWTRPEGGFFIWVTLPDALDAGRMLPQARERGIEYLPGVTCYAGGQGSNQIRLSFSFAEDDTIEPGIAILGELLRDELREVGAGGA
jgi:2-aminoadipate transaminase